MFEKITESDISKRSVAAVATTPNRKVPFGESGMNASQLKARFDLFPKYLADRLNEIFEGLANGQLANSLQVEFGKGNIDLASFVRKFSMGSVDDINIVTVYETISLAALAALAIEMRNGLSSGELAEKLIVDKGVTLQTFYANAKNNKGEDGKSITILSVTESNAARRFALELRTDGSIGKAATLTGFAFGVKGKVFTINGKEFTAAEGKWIYNQAVSSSTASAYSMIIYDKNYAGGFTTNNYGVAIVLDENGKLTKIYDGANVGYYTESGKAASAGFTSSTYATTAFVNLKEGETLIIFPNDGGTNTARSFALGLRTDGSIGKVATLSGFTFGLDNKVISINGKSFEVVYGKWLYNTEVTSDDASSYSLLIYDKNYTGSFSTNGYGVAAVFDADGILTKIYDGANLGFYTAEGKAEDAHFGAADFATVAFYELAEGETLLVFPNDGGYNIITFSDGTVVNIKNGHSPVMGADYFTPEDIEFIVNNLINRLAIDGTYNAESNRIATVQTVINKLTEIVANAPEDLNTLKEIADYIASDKTHASEINSKLSELTSKMSFYELYAAQELGRIQLTLEENTKNISALEEKHDEDYTNIAKAFDDLHDYAQGVIDGGGG